jgi:hypothetical protein
MLRFSKDGAGLFQEFSLLLAKPASGSTPGLPGKMADKVSLLGRQWSTGAAKRELMNFQFREREVQRRKSVGDKLSRW